MPITCNISSLHSYELSRETREILQEHHLITSQQLTVIQLIFSSIHSEKKTEPKKIIILN